MYKIDLLHQRKAKLLNSTLEIRKTISEIIDSDSFIELNAFSFSKNEFLEEELNGLGVITGYAKIDDNPVYIVAQNGTLLNGGLSKANCKKILYCLNKACEKKIPVVYLLDSKGVQMGENVEVLESIASLLAFSNELKEKTVQIAVAIGDTFGSSSLIYANADFSFVVDNACVSYASPNVISATAKEPLSKDVIGGNKSKNGLNTFAVKTLSEVKEKISKIFSILPEFSSIVNDDEEDLNRSTLALNSSFDTQILIDAIFDKDKFVEMYNGYQDDVLVGIGRVGGISVGAIIFAGKEDGVDLTLENVLKIKNFANFVYDNNMPMISLVNTNGFKKDYESLKTPIMVEFMNMLNALTGTARVSVIYNKAIGLGYSAFASKEFGNDYTIAFAGSKISLLDGVEGISATFGVIEKSKIEEYKEKYESSQDSFNAAKVGCVDNVIEPQFVRQYVISALQTFIR